MKILIAILLNLITAQFLLATTYNSDGTPTGHNYAGGSIQWIHDNQCVNGDTITLPNGTFNWTTGVRITKKITIQGNTTTNTVTGACNDLTIIIDNVSRVPNKPVFELVGGDQRVSGITFQEGLTTKLPGGINFVGSYGHPSRADHCHFVHPWFAPVINSTSCFGVVDHNVLNYGGSNQPGFVHAFFSDYGGKPYADGVWEVSAGFGGPEFQFIEDNYIDSGGTYACGTNCFDGGKICFRHNKLVNSVASTGNHGLSRHDSASRGGRATEFYNNELHWAQAWWGMDGTDGNTFLAHDNTWDGNLTWFGINYYRGFFSFGPTFKGADGANPWDLNVTEPDGTHIDGHPPYLFESGTLTSVGNQFSITDNTKNWATNQWVHYVVRRPSDGAIGAITANSNNTLTLYGFIAVGWSAGDSYQIHKVVRCMDQPGLGRSAPIDRANPAWPNQASEPSYQWNNVFTPTGEHLRFAPSLEAFFVQEGVDYFNDVPMPGYTPYTYPHPLVSGAPTPTPSPTPTATPAPGLVAAYGFNEGSGTVVNDVSGYGNNGTISGAAWTTSGKYGNALSFNGTNALVTINNAPSLQLTTGMTLEVWVYPTTVTAAWRDVIYKGNDNYYLEGSSNSGPPMAGAIFGGAYGEVYGPNALTANTWAHLAATYDGAAMRLYVNGVQVASRAETGAIATSTNPLQIGGDSIYGQYFEGRIDEVRIYNLALSVAQIQSDMNTPVGATPTPTPTPIATPTATATATP